jgi:hypothetical protein
MSEDRLSSEEGKAIMALKTDHLARVAKALRIKIDGRDHNEMVEAVLLKAEQRARSKSQRTPLAFIVEAEANPILKQAEEKKPTRQSGRVRTPSKKAQEANSREGTPKRKSKKADRDSGVEREESDQDQQARQQENDEHLRRDDDQDLEPRADQVPRENQEDQEDYEDGWLSEGSERPDERKRVPSPRPRMKSMAVKPHRERVSDRKRGRSRSHEDGSPHRRHRSAEKRNKVNKDRHHRRSHRERSDGQKTDHGSTRSHRRRDKQRSESPHEASEDVEHGQQWTKPTPTDGSLFAQDCVSCGAANPDFASFCAFCGKKLGPVVCTNCQLPINGYFCGMCGTHKDKMTDEAISGNQSISPNRVGGSSSSCSSSSAKSTPNKPEGETANTKPTTKPEEKVPLKMKRKQQGTALMTLFPKVVAAVEAATFVDLYDLVPLPVDPYKPKPSETEEAKKRAESAPKPVIKSYSTWARGFAKLIALATEMGLEEVAADWRVYFDTLLSHAETMKWSLMAHYDFVMRQARGREQSHEFAAWDWNLWDQTKRLAGDDGELKKTSSFIPLPPSGPRPNQKAGEKICFEWNSAASCSKKQCMFQHVCMGCKKPGHGWTKCFKAASGTPSTLSHTPAT